MLVVMLLQLYILYIAWLIRILINHNPAVINYAIKFCQMCWFSNVPILTLYYKIKTGLSICTLMYVLYYLIPIDWFINFYQNILLLWTCNVTRNMQTSWHCQFIMKTYIVSISIFLFQLVDLPTVTQCMKTTDMKTFYSVADICQVSILLIKRPLFIMTYDLMIANIDNNYLHLSHW